MKIYLASDHGGFELKEKIKIYLQDKGFEIEDVGAHQLDPTDDYPDFVIPLAQKVAEIPDSMGIVFGRTGNGEVIIANKVKKIRAALCLDKLMAKKARQDNFANVLSMGADLLDEGLAKEIVDVFITTPYSTEQRHKRRVGKIISYESS